MSVGIAEARPPYVSFETRAKENRTKSIEAGHYMADDVNYVIVTPQGSKDKIEFVVEKWFSMLEGEVRANRFPMEWLRGYKAHYEAFKEGKEIPLSGTPILTWPPASPAQAANLAAVGIRTVEDLAQANEEAIRRMGMGGRALKQKAEQWLITAANIGKSSEEINALKIANEELKATNVELTAQLKELKAAVESTMKSKEGAKP